MQVLTPGVQHGEEADGGAEVSGIGGDGRAGFPKRPGTGWYRSVLGSEAPGGRSAGEREHDVEIGNGQQFCLPLGEPLGASRGLALGAMRLRHELNTLTRCPHRSHS